jgi:hypothetical protein
MTARQIGWADAVASCCIIELMIETPPPLASLFDRRAFDADITPIYALTEQQLQQIINNLANLIAATLEALQQSDNEELTQLIAQHAYFILANYDDDIATTIRFLLQRNEVANESSLLL